MSKSLFFEVRQSFQSHYDKALGRYYKNQNADKNQIAQTKGEIQKWK